MPLCRIKNTIFNSDHILDATYHEKGRDQTLEIHLPYDGDDRGPQVMQLSGKEADAAWKYLCDLAVQIAVPA